MTEEDWIGRVIDGRYVVESVLGKGGMGVVLRARHRYTGALIALKTLRRELQLDAGLERRFLDEARAPNTIGHPGIVQVIDAGKTAEGELFLAMELLAGEPLRHAVARGLGAPSVRRIGLELLDALGAAHARGFVHRDLKPDNVFLVAPNATVKLLDFGIAKVVASRTVGVARTAAGMVLGTLAYMAPEQLADASGVDPRADLWAIGVMLYEMLSGRLPYRARTLEEMFIALAGHEPDPISVALPGAAPELERFFARALARDPRARFGSAAELAAELAQLPLGGPPPPAVAQPSGGLATAATGFASTGASGVTPGTAIGAHGLGSGAMPSGSGGLAASSVAAAGSSPGAPFAAPVGAAITAAPMMSTGAAITAAPMMSTGAAITAAPRASTGAAPSGDGAHWRRLAIGLGGVALLASIVAIAIAARGSGSANTSVAAIDPPPAAATDAGTQDPWNRGAVPPPPRREQAPPRREPAPPRREPPPIDGRPAHVGPVQPGPPRTVQRQDPPAPDACALGCAFHQSCGIPLGTCLQLCRSNKQINACVTGAQGSCTRLTSCYFQIACGGAAPTGTKSCNETMMCEQPCGTNSACACSCMAQMASSHALALFMLNGCAAHCNLDLPCINRDCTPYINVCGAQ